MRLNGRWFLFGIDGEGDAPAGGAGAGDAGTGDTGAGEGNLGYFNTMPDDWRSQAAKAAGYEEGTPEYEKRVKQLERVSDFGTLGKNYFEAQDRIRKGEISNGLPENPTDEQITAYREAHGIPASADAYELTLEEGLVLGEADTKIMSSVFEVAHARNIPAETMSAMTNAMLKGRQDEADARIAQDGVDTQTTNKMLKDTWGSDYQTNVNVITGLVNTLPESMREQFENARMGDGKALFNSPEFMVAMAGWARQLNPSATVVPNSNNPMQDMNSEIKALEGRMGDSDWHSDKEAQARYISLINARNSLEAQS